MAVSEFLSLVKGLEGEFHHGCCVGADYQAHNTALQLGYRTVIHPPLNSEAMASCVADETRQPQAYLRRNKAIVNECDVLIAIPDSRSEKVRSGTWSTVRYARKMEVPVLIAYPGCEPDTLTEQWQGEIK